MYIFVAALSKPIRSQYVLKLRKKSREILYIIFCIICIIIYSSNIYPSLSYKYGGGSPNTINIIVKSEVVNVVDKSQLSTIRNFSEITNGDKIYYRIGELKLIDKTQNQIIVCEFNENLCFVIPNSLVISIFWKY